MIKKDKEKKEYYLGLDLGTTSVGWAVFSKAVNEQGETINTMEDLGVRIFPEPVKDRSNDTLTEARRVHRGAKRLLRRKKHRVERLINLLDKIQFINKHHLQDFLTILRLSESKCKKYYNCCPQWIANREKEKNQNKNCFLTKYSVIDPRHEIKNKNKKFIDFYTLAKDAEQKKINPAFLSYILIYLARHRGYVQAFGEDGDNWLEKKAGEQKTFTSFTQLYNLIKIKNKSFPAIRNSKHWKDKNFTKESDFIKYNYSKTSTVPYEYIKKFIKINKLLKTKNKEEIIHLISKIDDKQKLEVIKKLADFIKNKELLNFILDFYDFDTHRTIISNSETIQLKIEDNLLKLPSSLKKDKLKSWYIKITQSGFEIIEGNYLKKEKEHWEYSQQMLINRGDLQKSFEKIFKEQIKYYPQLKKVKTDVIDTIFKQRTFEEGPGDSKKKYSGYNIQTLLKTGKRSEDGSLVGFRSSLIGDLHNVCCEFSKLILKIKDKDQKQKLYQNFLKEYLNFKSPYYKIKTSKELDDFKIYTFNFKKFAECNKERIDITSKIQSETEEKLKTLVKHIQTNIKITFLNLIFNIQAVNEKENANNQHLWQEISLKQEFDKTKNARFYISVILHEFHTPKKIFNILNGIVKSEREKILYKKIKDSSEIIAVKKILFKNNTIDEKTCLKNIISLKNILKGGTCNKSFKEMQNNINEFLKGKSTHENYYNNKQIFGQFNEKPLLITSETNDIIQEIQEKLIIQDKYRKLNNTFFKKNKVKIDVREKQEIKIKILKTDEQYTFKFQKINSRDNTPLKLPVISDFSIKANRRVYRAFSQTRKVLNALLKKYEYFKNINIELARDFYLSDKKKSELTKKQNENRKQNEEATEKGVSRQKLRIYKEHDGKCYLCHREIKLKDGELDHIIAQSIISDDSYNNLAWSCKSCNLAKSKKLPRECVKNFKDWKSKMEKFKSKKIKYRYLMTKSLEDPHVKEYIATSKLNDTRYIARFFYNYLQKNIGQKTKFQTKFNCIKGKVTSDYRKRWLWFDGAKNPWGFPDKKKIRNITDFHHAVDAVILCNLGTPQEYNLITAANQYKKWKKINKDSNEKDGQDYLSTIKKNNPFIGKEDIDKIENEEYAEPIFMKSEELRKELEQRIPVKLRNKKLIKLYVYFPGKNAVKCSNPKMNRFIQEKWLKITTKGRQCKGIEIPSWINDGDVQFIYEKKEVKTWDEILVKAHKNEKSFNFYIYRTTKSEYFEPAIKYQVEFSKIIQQEEYNQKWQYPYISRMVIRKVKRGSFGSEQPLGKEDAEEKIKKGNTNIVHDKHNNYWEMDNKWAYYFDKNKKKVIFLPSYQIQKKDNYRKIKNNDWNININNDDIQIQKENIVFKNELLKFNCSDNFTSYYVFVSGSTGKNVFVYLNQLNKMSGMAIDRKTNQIVKKNDLRFHFKKLFKNSKKININILGHKY